MRKRLVAVALLASLLLPATAAHAARYTIRWIMIHEPSTTAEEAARLFSQRIDKATKGDVRVEVLTRAQYAERYNGGRALSPHQAMERLQDGSIEMGQTYSWMMGEEAHGLVALGMPYLFADYGHAEKVLDGPIGRDMLADLTHNSNLRGLAFTYSGGFGMIATKHTVARRPEDLRGLRLDIGRAIYALPLEESLGIEAYNIWPEAFTTLAAAGQADGVETTFARFYEYGDAKEGRVIMNTEHYLLTTMIVINKKFLSTLPDADQRAVEQVAAEVGRRERQRTIALNDETRAKLIKDGVKVIDLTPAEKAAYAKALQPMYDILRSYVDPKLIEEIRQARNSSVTTAER